MKAIKNVVFLLFFLLAILSCQYKTTKVRFADTTRTHRKQINTSIKDTVLIATPTNEKKLKVKNHTNYIVSGLDEDGNSVHGAVLIEGKAGFGSLEREDSTTVEIIAEWSSTKKLIIATDEYGYLYRLTINNN
ncbi:hypothetical protein [Flavobacterium sp.]|uniref:hypothetical protein n=1 Tax=Flavobacterium sp. TaxID=239 RepID=UPI00262462DA|nr:hypothetical protein [Flavobacterium sp.]MDG2431253.1 hypothetical protein [Flavobacterium sp.]